MTSQSEHGHITHYDNVCQSYSLVFIPPTELRDRYLYQTPNSSFTIADMFSYRQSGYRNLVPKEASNKALPLVRLSQ